MKIHISHVVMSQGAVEAMIVFGHETRYCAADGQCGSAWDLPLPHVEHSSVKAGDIIDLPDPEPGNGG